MTPVDNRVWCDVHSDIHVPVERPYDGCPTEIRKGKPVWLTWQTYDKDGNEVDRACVKSQGDVEEMVPMEPECTAVDWKKLWSGASYEG